jgi:hypothetical protein
MSTTIRILKKDRKRLEKLAKKTGNNRLIDAFRFALYSAEREAEKYHGDLKSISRAQRFARPVGRSISSKVDENLAEALFEEIREQ